MGRYEKKDKTIFDFWRDVEITDKETGEKARGEGSSRSEAERNAFEALKSKSNSWNAKYKGSDDSGDSSCYLTTACVNVMGLPDNCLELNVLRNFKDKILTQTLEGRRAVREYYKIAPEIVQAIDKRKDAQNIWQAIYIDIRRAVSLVLSEDFEDAFNRYKQVTMRLKEKYLD